MFRRDRNYFDGGIRLCNKDNIAFKKINLHKENIAAEAKYLKKNIRKRKKLIIGIKKPPSPNDFLFLEHLSNNISTCLKDYDNILLLGYFSMTPELFQSRELNT